MIVVYKTDVERKSKADTILNAIRRKLPGCEASFDLEDCDNVLRVESRNGRIDEERIKEIVESYGYQMEILL